MKEPKSYRLEFQEVAKLMWVKKFTWNSIRLEFHKGKKNLKG